MKETLRGLGEASTLDGAVESLRAAGIDPTKPVKQYQYLPIYDGSDLAEAIPTAALRDPNIVNAAQLRSVAQVVATKLGTALEIGLGFLDVDELSDDAPLARMGTSVPVQFRATEEVINRLEYLQCAVEEFSKCQDRSSLSLQTMYEISLQIILINSLMSMRFQGSGVPGPDSQKNAHVQARLDALTADTLNGICSSIGAPPGSGGMLATLYLSPTGLWPKIFPALVNDYFLRQGRTQNDPDYTLGLEEALAKSAHAYLNQVLKGGPGGNLEKWFRLVDSWVGPFKFTQECIDPAEMARALAPILRDRLGPSQPDSPANDILLKFCSNREARVLQAINNLDARGFFGPPGTLTALLPSANEKSAARKLAAALDVTVYGGVPCLVAERGPHLSAHSTNLIRIPVLTERVLDASTQLPLYARVSQRLGGYDVAAESAFREFGRVHPKNFADAVSNLQFKVLVPPSDLMDATRISIFDTDPPDEPDSEASAADVKDDPQDLQASIKSALVQNAFKGTKPDEILSALRWLQAMRIAKKQESLAFVNDAEKALAQIARVAQGDASIDFCLRNHGFEIPAAELNLLTSVSTQAKAAALLTYALFERDFEAGNSAPFRSLSALLRVAHPVFEPLTRPIEDSNEPLHIRVLKHILNSDSADSCLDKGDITHSFGRQPRSRQAGAGRAARLFPEFSDVVLRGIKSPPGQAGIYESTRAYVPGDSLRLLDAKASARTDKLLVRERVEELDRSTILVIDLESLVDPVREKRVRQANTERNTTPDGLSSMLYELREADNNATQYAVVLAAGDVPLSILVTPNSRLRKYMQRTLATAGALNLVQNFTSLASIRTIGKHLTSYCFVREMEMMTPGVWEVPSAPLAMDWLNNTPRGVRLKVFANKTRLEQSRTPLSRFERQLARRGGQIEVAEMRTGLPPRPVL